MTNAADARPNSFGSKSTAPVAPNPRNPQLPPTQESPLRLKTLGPRSYTEDDWINEKYIDVILEVGNPITRIPGHRLVLEQSPALKKYFKYRTTRDIISLPNLNALGAVEVIRWLYSGELDIQETCLQKFNHIVHAAALLELKQHLNFWTIRREAVKYKKNKLVEYIDEMICGNFGSIVSGALFNGFEFEEIKELIKIVDRKVPVVNLFESVLQWAQIESKRGKFVETLLNMISIEDVCDTNPELIIKTFSSPQAIPNLNVKALKNLDFKKRVEALLLKYDKTKTNATQTDGNDPLPNPKQKIDPGTLKTSPKLINQNEPVPGTSKQIPPRKLSVDSDNSSIVECSAIIKPYRRRGAPAPNRPVKTEPGEPSDDRNSESSDYYPFAKRIKLVDIYERNYGLLYPITIHGLTYLDVYNFKTNKQERIHRVSGPQREFSSLVVAGNKIFDLGGTQDAAVSIWDNLSSSKLVQIFEKGEYEGKAGPSMRKALRVFGACYHDEVIYVTGGDCTAKEGTMVSSSLLQLNLYEESPRWQLKKPMYTPRSCHDLAVLNDDIYVVGGVGSDEDSAMKKTERYSTTYECWTKLPDMITGRRCLRVIAWKNKILAIGGEMTVKINDYRSLSSVEAYDPDTNTWELMCPMHYGRKSFGVVVVDDLIYVVGGNSESVEGYNIEVFNGEKWTVIDWPDTLNRHGKFISSVQLPIDYITDNQN